jgi:Xaa-Pro aminopeptidase
MPPEALPVEKRASSGVGTKQPPTSAGWKELAFGREEYDRRVARVRQSMAERGIEVLLIFTPENINYLTGYDTIGYSSYLCLALPVDSEPVMIIREMERGVAMSTTWLTDFATTGDTDDPIERTVDALRARNLSERRTAMEATAPFVTARTWLRLKGALGDQRVSDESDLVERARAVKSADEIAKIRSACRLVGPGMEAALAAVHQGATENEVAVAAYGAMVGNGSDPLVSNPIVTSGPRSGVAHTSFKNRQLRMGDTVLIELGACVDRYGGALMRTAVLGPPSSEVQTMNEVVLQALNAAIAAIKPGVTAGSVDQACRGVIEDAGFEAMFRKRTGYSVGVAFAPDWGEGHIVSLRRDDPTKLVPGMVFHIPPALRAFQRLCVGMSETVLVTDSGCEVLTHHPRSLHIAS